MARYDTVLSDMSDDTITVLEVVARGAILCPQPSRAGRSVAVELENFVNQLRSELQHRAAERYATDADIASITGITDLMRGEHEDLL